MPAILSIDKTDSDELNCITRNANGKPTSNGPALPADLISMIISNIQQDRLYATLAKMAQANSTFYDEVEYPVSRPKPVSFSLSSPAVSLSVSDTAVDRAYNILQCIT
jgi:hypothetical protein